MKNNKKRIDTYSTIWEIDIVVANKYVTLEDLRKLYSFSDGEELPEAIVENYATTCLVMNKKTKATCCLVKHNKSTNRTDIDKLLDIINTSVHEAVHCVLDCYNSCGVDIHYDNQEPVAYEIATMSTNILKTFLNK